MTIEYDEEGKVKLPKSEDEMGDIEGGEYESIPKLNRKILTEKNDPEIRSLCEKIDKKTIIARADFQRDYVWDNKPIIKSRLIESVLLEVPIPIIYTAETSDGKEEVIDGQQRILTFYHFKHNKFPLKGLTILKELNGKKFEDLSEELQDKFLSRGISVIKILAQSQKDIKFEIFIRLNRGSVKLNEQELRNCIYRGNFNDTLKDLVKNKDFLRLQGLKEPHKRMVDAERILRFFAFCEKTEHHYKGPLKKFLNDYMEPKRELTEKELKEKEQLFKKCVELCQQVFGDLAFRRWNPGTKEDPNGQREEKLNEGLMDIQLYGFMEYDKRQIVGKEQIIKDEFIDLVSEDKEFIESIEKGTYDTSKVKLRTEKWFNLLRKIIGYPQNERRIYTSEEKKYLYEKADGICQICKNKISFLEDAHVDHIERYSEGGKTIIKNGQITHRYCNLHKG
jgi:5-methylcytosine-specific restriction endonuclease McrA